MMDSLFHCSHNTTFLSKHFSVCIEAIMYEIITSEPRGFVRFIKSTACLTFPIFFASIRYTTYFLKRSRWGSIQSRLALFARSLCKNHQYPPHWSVLMHFRLKIASFCLSRGSGVNCRSSVNTDGAASPSFYGHLPRFVDGVEEPCEFIGLISF